MAYSYNSGGTVRPITVTVPAGNYYFKTTHAGTYANAAIKFVGQGGGAIFQTTATFNDTASLPSSMMDFANCTIAFQNCTINMQYGPPRGDGSSCMIRAGKWLNFSGCTLDSHWLDQTTTIEHNVISIGPIGLSAGCVVKGGGVYLINKGLISNGTSWYATNGQQNIGGVITSQTGARFHIVSDTFQHFDTTNMALCGTGRIFWFIPGNSYAGDYIHAESITTSLFGEQIQNQGEKFGWDGSDGAASSASVISATSNTITASFPGVAYPNWTDQAIAITNGKGEGQVRRIIWQQSNGQGGIPVGTYTIEQPWDVIPDATSTAYQGASANYVTIAESAIQGWVDANGASGLTPAMPRKDGSSCLVQNFVVMTNKWNICNNTGDGLINGFVGSLYIFNTLFSDITFTHVLNDYLNTNGPPKGLVFRRISGAKGSGGGAAVGQFYTSRSGDMCAVDRLNLTDCKIGLQIPNSSAGQINLWNCAFNAGSQSAGSQAIDNTAPITVNQLNGTSFTGFAS